MPSKNSNDGQKLVKNIAQIFQSGSLNPRLLKIGCENCKNFLVDRLLEIHSLYQKIIIINTCSNNKNNI